MSESSEDEGQGTKTFRGFAHPGIDEEPRDHAAERESPKTIPAPFLGPEDTDKAAAPGAEADAAPEPPESRDQPMPSPVIPRSLHDDVPLVEIEVVHQHGPAPRMEQPAQVLEVWTQNRIYTMDASQQCVRVTDRESQDSDSAHPFLGHKLVGGQHRERDTFELSYPFPRPGTEAVFEHPSTTRGQFSRTSTVHRVVLRLHVITVAPSRLVPTWAGITNHELALPPGDKS